MPGKKSPAAAARYVKKRAKPVEQVSLWVRILVYGRNKKGKTVFGATGPKPFILDIDEEGTRSAYGSGAFVYEASSFDEAVWAYWYMKEGNHKYKTFVVDTITALHKAALRKVMKESEERDPTKEPGTASQRDWGRANNLVNNLLIDMRNLPMHVVFLAQERVVADEDEEEPSLHTVDLPNGARGTALGCVGIIGRIYLKEVKTKGKKTKWEGRLLVAPHDEYDTGTRVKSLPRIVRQPTMPKIIKAWKETPPEEEE